MREHIFGAESISNNKSVSNAIFNWGNPADRLSNQSVHLIDLIEQKLKNNEKFYSFELFPVKDAEKYQRFFSETNKYSPLFHAITWHCGKNVNNLDLENILPLRIAEQFPCNTLLHLAAKGLKSKNIERILNRALESGIKNIFALQGDSSLEIGETSDFVYAVDLVAFIRKQFGSKFCICVAGYPETHSKSPSKELDLFYLKEKVDAGANFIISQIFFEARNFIEFVKDCRKINIRIPIIPGIFPITDYKSLLRMSNICNVQIPKFLFEALEPIKDNNEAVRKFGTELTLRIIKEIFESGTANGFHLFTLNRYSVLSDVCGHPVLN
ncbi:methylenetetrahydrofolate reductase [Belonocnema kinseyi]|uniref:methylenetetrahydrofolate reductase n=1 Tax=Belonocnema kinseyi TaxID=2817044 RepID=UPI00143DC9A6|nr:methylenetetrahydrofolate reductase [Belonocnema kinseyi]